MSMTRRNGTPRVLTPEELAKVTVADLQGPDPGDVQITRGGTDEKGRTLVVATWDGAMHRGRIDLDLPYSRREFREGAIAKLGLPDTEETHAAIEAILQQQAEAVEAAADDGLAPVLLNMADVEAKDVVWHWPGRIASGKLAICIGDPGAGKSFWTLDLAARTTRGTKWPDCDSRAPLGGVLLLSAEDDASDTIAPRLIASGADLTRINLLAGVEGDDEAGQYRRPFDLARDLPRLEMAIGQTPDCRLVVIDPISAFCGNTDEHKNADVRRLLHPLSELAAKHNVAVVLVSHLRKSAGSALQRAMGSLAFVAAARSAWTISKDKADERRRLFLPAKNNLGNDVTGLAFTITARHTGGAPCVLWEADAVHLTADEALGEQAKRPGPDPDDKADAEAFLLAALADGPRLVKDLESEAREAHGIAKRTLERARKALGVIAFRETPTGPWLIKLPHPANHNATERQAETTRRCGGVGETERDVHTLPPREGQNAKFSISGEEPGSLGGNGHDDEAVNRLFQEADG